MNVYYVLKNVFGKHFECQMNEGNEDIVIKKYGYF